LKRWSSLEEGQQPNHPIRSEFESYPLADDSKSYFEYKHVEASLVGRL
jgi:hypothetical protein